MPILLYQLITHFTSFQYNHKALYMIVHTEQQVLFLGCVYPQIPPFPGPGQIRGCWANCLLADATGICSSEPRSAHIWALPGALDLKEEIRAAVDHWSHPLSISFPDSSPGLAEEQGEQGDLGGGGWDRIWSVLPSYWELVSSTSCSH